MSKFAVLISTCDKYFPIAKIQARALDELVLNGEMDVDKYIITGSQLDSVDGWNVICGGSANSWSNNMIKGLREIHNDIILHVNDDTIPILIEYEKVSLMECFMRFKEINANYLKISGFNQTKSNLRLQFYEFEKDEAYRTSLVYSIWKKDTLASLLRPDETPWQFETNGTNRSKRYNGFYKLNCNIVAFSNLVVRGKMVPSELKKISERVANQLPDWPIMTRYEDIAYKLGIYFRRMLLSFLPKIFRKRYLDFKYSKV